MTAALLTWGTFTYSFQVLVYLMGSDEPARELAGISMGKQRVNSISRQLGGRSPIAAIKVTKHAIAFPETPLRSRSFTSHSVIFQRRNVGRASRAFPLLYSNSARRSTFFLPSLDRSAAVRMSSTAGGIKLLASNWFDGAARSHSVPLQAWSDQWAVDF